MQVTCFFVQTLMRPLERMATSRFPNIVFKTNSIFIECKCMRAIDIISSTHLNLLRKFIAELYCMKMQFYGSLYGLSEQAFIVVNLEFHELF